jgi:hypothetical protein
MRSTKMPPPVKETARQADTTKQAAGTAWEEFSTGWEKCASDMSDLSYYMEKSKELLDLLGTEIQAVGRVSFDDAEQGDAEAISMAITVSKDIKQMTPVFNSVVEIFSNCYALAKKLSSEMVVLSRTRKDPMKPKSGNIAAWKEIHDAWWDNLNEQEESSMAESLRCLLSLMVEYADNSVLQSRLVHWKISPDERDAVKKANSVISAFHMIYVLLYTAREETEKLENAINEQYEQSDNLHGDFILACHDELGIEWNVEGKSLKWEKRENNPEPKEA